MDNDKLITWMWLEEVPPKFTKKKKKELKDDRENVAVHTTVKGDGKIARLRRQK